MVLHHPGHRLSVFVLDPGMLSALAGLAAPDVCERLIVKMKEPAGKRLARLGSPDGIQ